MRTLYKQTEKNVCSLKTRVSATFMCGGDQKVTATGARDIPNAWKKIDASVGVAWWIPMDRIVRLDLWRTET